MTRSAERTGPISDRRARRRQLDWRAILDAVSQPVIVTDASGIVTACNQLAAWLTGYAANEVVGQLPLAVLFDRAEVAAPVRTLAPEAAQCLELGIDALVLASSKGLVEGEWTLVRKDGRRVPVIVAWRALRGPLGTLEGCVVLPRAAPSALAERAAPSTPGVAWGERLPASAAPETCFALGDLLRRLDDDRALLGEIAELFERERIALAADIRHAVEQRDAGAVARSAHRLRSALLNLAAGPAAEAALHLEDGGRLGRLPNADALALLFGELERLSAALASFRGASR